MNTNPRVAAILFSGQVWACRIYLGKFINQASLILSLLKLLLVFLSDGCMRLKFRGIRKHVICLGNSFGFKITTFYNLRNYLSRLYFRLWVFSCLIGVSIDFNHIQKLDKCLNIRFQIEPLLNLSYLNWPCSHLEGLCTTWKLLSEVKHDNTMKGVRGSSLERFHFAWQNPHLNL